MKKQLSIALFTFACCGAPFTASASLIDQYQCDYGDLGFTVMVNPLEPDTAQVQSSASEMMAPEMTRMFTLQKTPAASGQQWTGKDKVFGAVLFHSKGDMALMMINEDRADCTFVMEPNEQDHSTGAVGGQEHALKATFGQSLGGNMREAPNGDSRKIAKVKDDRDLIILGRSGAVDRGFPWFHVQLPDGRTGFMRGSNLCSTGYQVDGIYERCRGDSDTRGNGRNTYNRHTDRGTAGLSGNQYDWMAFAIDETGRVGHGVHPKRSMATTIAMKNCGSGCRVVDTAQNKCHALYQSTQNGYWFGVAHHENGAFAQNNAKKFCKKGAPKKSCERAYSYCQPTY